MMTVDRLRFVYLLMRCEPQHQVLDFPVIAGTQFNTHSLILYVTVIENAYIFTDKIALKDNHDCEKNLSYIYENNESGFIIIENRPPQNHALAMLDIYML